MDFQIEASTKTGRLILNGEMGIQHAAALKDQLLNVQESVEHLDLDVQSVTGLDVSALQILCSAHRSFMKLRKEITFAGPLPPVWTDFMEVAGFARGKGCSVDSNSTCLWMKKRNL
jgi:anti-anti-sigma regulatory factor